MDCRPDEKTNEHNHGREGRKIIASRKEREGEMLDKEVEKVMW